MIFSRYGLLLLACTVLLTACSGIKPYPNKLDKNLVINTETDSGSVFSSIKASLDIYDVDAACKLNYIGTVKLDQPEIEVGLEPERITYLSFRFDSSGFLSSSSSTISYETLIKPRKSYRYDARVYYKQDIYNVGIFEKRSAKDRGHELEMRDLKDCNIQ